MPKEVAVKTYIEAKLDGQKLSPALDRRLSVFRALPEDDKVVIDGVVQELMSIIPDQYQFGVMSAFELVSALGEFMAGKPVVVNQTHLLDKRMKYKVRTGQPGGNYHPVRKENSRSMVARLGNRQGLFSREDK